MAEGDFPKTDGDILFASEVNKMIQGKYTYVATADFDDSSFFYMYNIF